MLLTMSLSKTMGNKYIIAQTIPDQLSCQYGVEIMVYAIDI